MLKDNLFKHVLIDPATKLGINRLQIVTGFATAGMIDRHMEHLKSKSLNVDIDLIIGMTKYAGIEKAQHFALKKLVEEKPFGLDFRCLYVVNGNPVHAKSYCWLNGTKPQIAFLGSANYTLTAFGRSQIEVMTNADPSEAKRFYDSILGCATDCSDVDIESKVLLTESRTIENNADGETVTLTLLDKRTRDTPKRSGINWGHRGSRDRNQAYINIPAPHRKGNFFPKRGEQFTVLTDDRYSFIMVRAQDGGKGLHTTQNNALLGKYLRDRIGMHSGDYVERQHLVKYGRTDVTFTKIDEETYLMDFRPNMGPGEDVETWQK